MIFEIITNTNMQKKNETTVLDVRIQVINSKIPITLNCIEQVSYSCKFSVF